MTVGTTDGGLDKQYERVLAEYRFQVQLNWDRAKHYLTFNTLLGGAAVALSKDASGPTYAGVAVLLCIASFNSFLGQFAVAQGQEYYRAVRSTKTALERALNLDEYAIVTTPGMKREHNIAVAGIPATRPSRLGRITQQIRLLLIVIGTFALVGAVWAAHAAVCAT